MNAADHSPRGPAALDTMKPSRARAAEDSAVQPRPPEAILAPSAVSLPFIVRIARTEEHLARAVDVRAETYQRHHPELVEQLREPEASDRAPNTLVLLAENKETGTALGTLRIETNFYSPLAIETLLPVKSQLSEQTIAYVTRLGVRQGSLAQLVKLALFKALHRYCLACQINWIIVTAKPPMDRQYVRLGFIDVFEDNRLVAIPWSQNILTRILALDTIGAERNWREVGHPLYKFMIEDYCPDIQVFSSVSGSWTRPRTGRALPPGEELLAEVFGHGVI